MIPPLYFFPKAGRWGRNSETIILGKCVFLNFCSFIIRVQILTPLVLTTYSLLLSVQLRSLFTRRDLLAILYVWDCGPLKTFFPHSGFLCDICQSEILGAKMLVPASVETCLKPRNEDSTFRWGRSCQKCRDQKVHQISEYIGGEKPMASISGSNPDREEGQFSLARKREEQFRGSERQMVH